MGKYLFAEIKQPQPRTHAIAVDVDLSVKAGSESVVLRYLDAQCGHMAVQEPHKPCERGANAEEDPLWRHPRAVPAFPLTGIRARQSTGLRLVQDTTPERLLRLRGPAAGTGCSLSCMLCEGKVYQ